MHDPNSQQIIVYANLPIISKVNNKSLDIVNNEQFVVSELTSTGQILIQDKILKDMKFKSKPINNKDDDKNNNKYLMNKLNIPENEMFTVVEILDEKFIISNGLRQIDIHKKYLYKLGKLFEIRQLLLSVDEFQLIFYPSYCITVHSAQGATYDFPYTIHEWNRYSKKMKYTALTRSTCLENVNII